MRQRGVFLVIFLLYISGFFAHALLLKKTAYGDGIYYYSWLHSLALDHDISFRNEYEAFGVDQPVTQTGLSANKYAIGPALLWLPNYLTIHTAVRGSGYEFPYQLTVGITGALYALVGLLLLYRLLSRFYTPDVSAAATFGIAIATNLYFYGSLDTVNSHAVSFFAAVVFLSVLFAPKKNWLAAGAALGLLTLIRHQDILFGLLFIPFWKTVRWERVTIGLIIALLPQVTAWHILYGKFWISPYLTGGEGFFPLSPNIFGVLFSLQNGLFLWTPLTILGTCGLLFLRPGLPKRWFMGLVLLQIYTVASWIIWWQGASYSGRMFISILPILAFGLAQTFRWLRSHRFLPKQFLFTIITPLAAVNFLLMAYFLYRM